MPISRYLVTPRLPLLTAHPTRNSAYGYGRLALAGYKYVGADQLIGGPWPDNEPAVSSLDWTTGQPNAKYWAITMLAKALGSGKKSLYAANVTAMPPPPPPPVGSRGNGTCGATSFGGDCNLDASGALDARKEGILNLSACVARARGCKMADYVSFSLKDWNSDCSWYHKCDFVTPAAFKPTRPALSHTRRLLVRQRI